MKKNLTQRRKGKTKKNHSEKEAKCCKLTEFHFTLRILVTVSQ